MRRGAAWTVKRHQAAAWSLPWLRSRWQSCHRRATLVAKPQTPAHRWRLGVSWRAALWSWRSRMSERLPSRSSVACPRRFRVRHGVPGGVDGVRPDTTGRRCPKALSDRAVHGGRRTGPRTSDGDQACGVPASNTGAGGHDGQVPMLVAAGVGRREHAHCRAVRSGVRTCRPRGGRCPPLGRRRPNQVRTQRLGGHIELGMSGRPDAREGRHVRHPASHWRVSAGGTDRRRRCPDECPPAAP